MEDTDIVEKKHTIDAFNFYKANTENPLGYNAYTKIAFGYTNFIIDKVMDGNDVQLGAKLGTIAIRGKKARPVINCRGEIRGVAPAWGKTKKMWTAKAEALGLSFEEYVATTPKEERELVYCFNEHTNGIRYSLLWFNKNVNVMNKAYYSLTFMRRVKRAIMNAVNNGKEYLVLHERTTDIELQLARERADVVLEEITGIKTKKPNTWVD